MPEVSAWVKPRRSAVVSRAHSLSHFSDCGCARLWGPRCGLDKSLSAGGVFASLPLQSGGLGPVRYVFALSWLVIVLPLGSAIGGVGRSSIGTFGFTSPLRDSTRDYSDHPTCS